MNFINVICQKKSVKLIPSMEYSFFLHKTLFCLLTFRFVDDNEEKYIKRLADAVAIKSVSTWPETRSEVRKMVENVAKVW